MGRLFRRLGRKGQGEWSEVFMTVIITACTIMVGIQIPGMVSDVVTLMALASAEKTARDLGGMITISGAATDEMIITYESEDPEIQYDMKIKDRKIMISEITKDGEPLKKADSPISKGWGKIAVGDISEIFEDKNVFRIERIRVTVDDDVVNDYEVIAESR